MGCDITADACKSVMGFTGMGSGKDLNNNDQDMIALNTAGGNNNSGSTELSEQFLPAGAKVTYALLEWSANRSQLDTEWTGKTSQARFRVPNGDYEPITADTVSVRTEDARDYYQARANVTALVAAAGNGTYSLADMALAASDLDPTATYYGGFTLTVVYELPSLPVSRVALFAGSQWVTSASTADFSFYADKTAQVSVGWTAWDGDRGTSGDHASLDSDNFQSYGWSGTALTKSDAANAADSTAFGSKYANTLGVDAKSFVTKDKVKSGLHKIRAWTAGDNYLIGSLTVTLTYGD